MLRGLSLKLLQSFKLHTEPTHLCHFYKNADRMVPVLESFVRVSRELQQPCLVLWDNYYKVKVPAELRQLKDSNVTWLRGRELSSLTRSPKALLGYQRAWYQKVNPQGDKLCRMYCVMNVFLLNQHFVKELAWWEKQTRSFFRKRKVYGVYEYDEGRLDEKVIKYIIQTHPNILVEGKVYPNQYYLPATKRSSTHYVSEIVADVKQKATQQAEEIQSRETQHIAQNVGKIGMFEWDIPENKLHYSREFKKIYGWTIERNLDRFEDWLERVHPDDRPRVKKTVLWCIENHRNINIEFRIILPNGDFRWILAKGHIDYGEKLAPVRVVGVHIDITDKQLAVESKYEVISLASHEMRMPLTVLKGYTYLMRKCITDSDLKKSQQYLSKMNVQINRLNRYIEDLLNIYKIDRQIFDLQLEEVSLDALIKKVVRENMLGGSKHVITIDHNERAVVSADPHLIEGVLVNLVTNALKYSPEGSKVLVTSQCKGQRVRVSITDHGMGISPDKQKEIFKRFYRAAGSESASGLGIGLYLAAEIIKKHRGAIGVISQLGKGSTFYFELPLVS